MLLRRFIFCCVLLSGSGLYPGLALAETPAAGSTQTIVEGKARFQVLAPDLIRMETSPGAQFCNEPSVAVLKRDWPDAKAQSEHKDGWLEIRTGKLTLRYKLDADAFSSATLKITWTDAGNEHAWKPGDKDEQNLGGVVGDIAIRSTPVTDPGLLSRAGYTLLDDSHTPLRDAATEWIRPRPAQDGQDWYFFVYGRDYAGMLRRCAELLGPVPMVPKYVLGAWFGSRAGYAQNQWELIVDRYREEKLPLDMLIVDSCSWTNVIWSGYDFDYEQLPDPKGFIQGMLTRGVHTSFNEHYGAITRQSDHNFEALCQAAGVKPRAAATTDSTHAVLSPETPKDVATMGGATGPGAGVEALNHNFADKKYFDAFAKLDLKPLLDMGMAFWWQDGCAPAPGIAGLDPMMWTRELEYRAQERLTNKRSFVFCRLGGWGSHRSGGFFSSDLIPQWNTLGLIVPFTQQSGNMLVPYVVNLCGGVYGINLEPELYHRWMQFSCFSPVFWFHGVWGLRLPWEYGDQGVELYRKFAGLRYQLQPYTYTLTREAHETALPLVRGMYLEYPDQEAAYQARQQFMFGSELLVAPVIEPGRGKPVTKEVYLPAGEDWVDYFTGKVYPGGQTLPYPCPLERIPLFVKAGAILPMGPVPDYTDQKPLDNLTLDVYARAPGAHGAPGAQGRLYEDDGVSLGYRQNKFAWTRFDLTPHEADWQLTVQPAEGEFAGQAPARKYEIRLHGLVKPEAVSLNGQPVDEKEVGEEGTRWTWDNQARVTTIRLREALSIRKPVTVTIKGGGSYADGLMLARVMDYRDRVRLVKRDLKLKYAFLSGTGEHSKPPLVIRETEAVETALNAMVANPRGLGQNPPDFKGLTQRVLTALVNKPFDSTRTIPELNDSCLATTKLIADAHFEPAELRQMTATLLGLELQTHVSYDMPQFYTVGHFVHVRGRLGYDAAAVGPAQVSYELAPPEEADGQRSWVCGAPVVGGDGIVQFDVQNPSPTMAGPHVFKLRAILKWDGGQTELTRDAEWFSVALP